MLKRFLLVVLCVFPLGINGITYAADTEVALDTTDSTSGFTVKNSANQTIMRAGGDGNVGIGTTSPSAKLEVNGEIKGFGIVPIGSIIAWHKSLPGTPSLPDGWVECSGQTLNDLESPLNGQVIPNLNGTARFLRGASSSGTFQSDQANAITSVYTHNQGDSWPHDTSTSVPESGWSSYVFTGEDSGAGYQSQWTKFYKPGRETHPINMSVVWVMRVK